MRREFPISNFQFSNQEGQSLVEMIVAIAVAVVVILALVRATTTSIRNANFAKNRALATKYAQEALETVRLYKVQNPWQAFTGACDSIPGMPSPPSPFTLLVDCYKSECIPSTNCCGSIDTCEVKATVSWSDSQGTHKSELTTQLTNWQ